MNYIGPLGADLAPTVARAERPDDRDKWLDLGGWRTEGRFPGTALLSTLTENA